MFYFLLFVFLYVMMMVATFVAFSLYMAYMDEPRGDDLKFLFLTSVMWPIFIPVTIWVEVVEKHGYKLFNRYMAFLRSVLKKDK